MINLIVYGTLILLWLAVIVLASRWSDDDKPARPAPFTAHTDATVVLAAVPSWYQLDHEGRRTDDLLERAARVLEVAA